VVDAVLGRPWLAAVVGGVVGGVVVGVLAAGGWLPEAAPAAAPPVTARPGQAVALAFLGRWRAHLSASWSVNQVLERVATSGSRLRVDVHEAQRPPDSLRVGLGSIDARQGSTVTACAALPGSTQPVCRSAPAVGTWQQRVDAEMAGLRAALIGPSPVYAVSAPSPDCFAFELLRSPATVPVGLGRRAQYCLDPETLAVLSSRVERAGTVDTVTTVEHHAPAVDADLALPAGVKAG